MKKILTEISSGELLDKISILEIKLENIKDNESYKKISKELDILNEVKNSNIKMNDNLNVLYKKLKEANLSLWKIEDEIRFCEKNKNFGEKFVKLARDVYFTNDQRSKLKLQINKILGSSIEEVKKYTKY